MADRIDSTIPPDDYLGVNIIGATPRMQRIFRFVSKVAPTESAVLITGESGTGKELVARSIHIQSSRANHPFLAVNTGALPENLLESELFGHVRGAFTGATVDKKGLFEQADGGTLFLDEVGELAPQSQVKLLRALQDGEVRRVGSNESVRVDVRPISATNKDLRKAMEEGTFREDLYYRLNVVSVKLPPLRDRREDIPLLARHFVNRLAIELSVPTNGITEDALKLLIDYDWPGNVRELENAIERAMATCGKERLCESCFDFLSTRGRRAKGGFTAPVNLTLAQVELQVIPAVLDDTGWNVKAAAAVLGIDRSTLYEKIKKYGIERPQRG